MKFVIKSTKGYSIRSVLAGSTLSLLCACGGGGSSSTPTTPPPVIPPPVTPPSTLDHSGLTPMTADEIDNDEYLSAGAITLFVSNEDAFSSRAAPVTQNFRFDGNFTTGDHIFRTPHDGAGPLLNTTNCQGCHLNDGRGVLPTSPEQPFTSALVKIGDALGNPDPVYGDQIQTFAEQSFNTADFRSGWPEYNGSLNGDVLKGEAFTYIEYEDVQGNYADGTQYSLRKPVYKIKDLSFGPFIDDIRISVRLAPHVFGSGLIGAIPQGNILALADPNDSDNNGISGRASMVTDVTTQQTTLGRFTYKAQAPTVLQQAAAAYRGDTGVTSSIFIEEPCSDVQISCNTVAQREQKTGSEPDIADSELAAVEFYNRVLGVPARRGYNEQTQAWEPDVAQGRKLFFETGCIDCHTPRHVTGEAKGSVLGEISLVGLESDAAPIEMLSNQTIYPYTDLLLHDMGGSCQITRELADGTSCINGQQCLYVQRCDGLADGLIQGMASGSEWKTPPLWGLGLVNVVNANSTFLHDGRARTIEEAILWHAGEAEKSRQAFTKLESEERAQLLLFLGSL